MSKYSRCACFAPGEVGGSCPGVENCPIATDPDDEYVFRDNSGPLHQTSDVTGFADYFMNDETAEKVKAYLGVDVDKDVILIGPAYEDEFFDYFDDAGDEIFRSTETLDAWADLGHYVYGDLKLKCVAFQDASPIGFFVNRKEYESTQVVS